MMITLAELQDQILMKIAEYTPFSYQEIKYTFLRAGSIDATLLIIQFAIATESLLSDIIENELHL